MSRGVAHLQECTPVVVRVAQVPQHAQPVLAHLRDGSELRVTVTPRGIIAIICSGSQSCIGVQNSAASGT